MRDKASLAKVTFRPHFKTHQSNIVASWFMHEGVKQITVSSVSMAFQFAEQGWQDITIAFPCNIREIESINHLGNRVKINLLIDSAATAKFLANNLFQNTNIYIEIDSGHHRSGVKWDDEKYIINILDILNNSAYTNFRGFLTHSGETYHAKGEKEIMEIFHQTRKRLLTLKEKHNLDALLSIGDTPSCSLKNEFNGLDEIRPGNFVYYDLMQESLGVCSYEDIAVAMACPVVSINQSRKEIIIYGGAVHFSKDHLLTKNNQIVYGLPVKISENGWSGILQDSSLERLSQEHGIIKTSTSILNQFRVGDLIGILPVHSCLTADLMKNRTMIIS